MRFEQYGTGSWELRWWHDPPSGGLRVEQCAHARSLIRQIAADPSSRSELHAFCESTLPSYRFTHMTDANFVEFLSAMVEDGRLVLAHVPLRIRVPGYAAPVEQVAADEPEAPRKKKEPAAQVQPTKQKCANPACADAFSSAADSGTPLVTADAEGC